MLPPTSILVELARPTLGVTTRERLLDVLSRHQLDRLVHQGTLTCVQPSVFRVAGFLPTYQQQVMAATIRSGAVGSHRSAAYLWNLSDRPLVVDVSVPHECRPRLRDVLVHRSRDLAPDHLSVVEGIRVTNPMRTLVDVGAVVRRRQAVEDMLDLALTTRLVTIIGLEALLAELAGPGRRGVGVLGAILDERALGTQRADGLLEPRMARLLRSAKLPLAVFQHQVRIGRRRFFVDFAYPNLMIAIEVDGAGKFGRPRALQETWERQNLLVRAGWTVLRFTWDDVVRRPAYVAQVIADEIRARGLATL